MKNILTSELVARLRQGDHRAYEIIFNAYYKVLWLFAGKMLDDQHLAEDVVLDVFVKIWEKRAELKLTEAYLNTMVINRCLDHIRHRKVVRKAMEEMSYTTKEEEDLLKDIQRCMIEAEFKLDVFQWNVNEAMLEMPPEVRLVFWMFHHRNMKTKEIAAAKNVSIKTVQLQLRIAMNMLRARLKKLG